MSALPFFIAPSSSAQATSEATQNTPVAVIAGNGGAGLADVVNAVQRLQGTQNEPAEQAIANQSPLFGQSGGIPKWVWYVAAGVLVWAVVKRL